MILHIILSISIPIVFVQEGLMIHCIKVRASTVHSGIDDFPCSGTAVFPCQPLGSVIHNAPGLDFTPECVSPPQTRRCVCPRYSMGVRVMDTSWVTRRGSSTLARKTSSTPPGAQAPDALIPELPAEPGPSPTPSPATGERAR